MQRPMGTFREKTVVGNDCKDVRMSVKLSKFFGIRHMYMPT